MPSCMTKPLPKPRTTPSGWLVSAAYGYHNLRRTNANRVKVMGILLTVLGALMVLQTVFWLLALR